MMRRLSDREKARDLAQEAYLRVLSVKHTELITAPRAYLLRIASNLLYESAARDKRNPVFFNSHLAESKMTPDLQTGDPREIVDALQQINAVLSRLPSLHATILVLRKRDGFSLEEIARKLDISVHTAKKYLCRALAKCRQEISKATLILMVAALLSTGCAPDARPAMSPKTSPSESEQPCIVVDGKHHCFPEDSR